VPQIKLFTVLIQRLNINLRLDNLQKETALSHEHQSCPFPVRRPALNELPFELLQVIFEHKDLSQHDLLALLLTYKRIRSIVSRRVYDEVSLSRKLGRFCILVLY